MSAMHKAICTSCKKEFESPIIPDGTRRVYCQNCYSKKVLNKNVKPGFAICPYCLVRFREDRLSNHIKRVGHKTLYSERPVHTPPKKIEDRDRISVGRIPPTDNKVREGY